MMLFLVPHVRFGFVTVLWANGEHAITTLPIELPILRSDRLDEFGRLAFYLLDELHRRMHLSHIEENVSMIGDSAYDNPW